MRWSAGLIAVACALIPTLAFAEDAPYPVHPDPSALPPLPAPVAIVEEHPATIPESAQDTVYLRGGGMMRGAIEEILPGHHVTIALSTGEVRKVPWVEVARVVVANAPGAPGLTASAAQIQIDRPAVVPAPNEAAVVPMSGPLARVHVASPKLVQLYRREAVTKGWTLACHSPCDIDLPIGDTYRVSGSSMTTSREFSLAGVSGDRITITVKPTSSGGMVAGGILGGVGLILIYGGLAANSEADRSGSNSGYTAIGLGVIGVAVGAAVMLASAGTSASQTSVSKRKDAYVREPSWLAPRLAVSRPQTLQILSRDF